MDPSNDTYGSDTADRGSAYRSSMPNKGSEKLYDAYNELHSMAQAFDKPFDAPAVLVVGHQTDGKSGGRKAHCCCSYTAKYELMAAGSMRAGFGRALE